MLWLEWTAPEIISRSTSRDCWLGFPCGVSQCWLHCEGFIFQVSIAYMLYYSRSKAVKYRKSEFLLVFNWHPQSSIPSGNNLSCVSVPAPFIPHLPCSSPHHSMPHSLHWTSFSCTTAVPLAMYLTATWAPISGSFHTVYLKYSIWTFPCFHIPLHSLSGVSCAGLSSALSQLTGGLLVSLVPNCLAVLLMSTTLLCN